MASISPYRHAGIQRVLIVTLIANTLVAAAKIIVGFLTHSLAMVADGVHSSMDGISNVIGLVSNALAARPPDKEHPYGHRRFETLASMMIGGILLLTGWEIIQSSIERLRGHAIPEITPVNFVAMIVTLFVNVGVTAYERRAGLRYNSELLLADAEHTRSDILVSLTVLASLIAVWLGWVWVDAVAALLVVGLIGVVAWQIVRRSAGILVDRAALDPEMVTEIVEGVAGVRRVMRVRSRGPSDEIHVDLDIQVAGPTTAAHSDSIAREARARLREKFHGLTDIEMHFLPARDAPPDLALIVRSEADALGLGVHEIIPASADGKLSLEMHVEVPPEQSISSAHDVVTDLEQRLKAALPDLDRVVTHIEPAALPEHIPSESGDAHILAHRALKLAESLYPENTWHDLDIRVEPDGGYALSMHCHVPPDMPLEDAHQIAESVETQVRAMLPMLHRVTIHTEPRGT